MRDSIWQQGRGPREVRVAWLTERPIKIVFLGELTRPLKIVPRGLTVACSHLNGCRSTIVQVRDYSVQQIHRMTKERPCLLSG